MTLRLVASSMVRSAWRTATVADIDDDGVEHGRWLVQWQSRCPDWCDCYGPGTAAIDDDWPPVQMNGAGLVIRPRVCEVCGLIVSPQIKIVPGDRPVVRPANRRKRATATPQAPRQYEREPSRAARIVETADRLCTLAAAGIARHDCRAFTPRWNAAGDCRLCRLRVVRMRVGDPHRVRRDAYLAAAEIVAPSKKDWIDGRAGHVRAAEKYVRDRT